MIGLVGVWDAKAQLAGSKVAPNSIGICLKAYLESFDTMLFSLTPEYSTLVESVNLYMVKAFATTLWSTERMLLTLLIGECLKQLA